MRYYQRYAQARALWRSVLRIIAGTARGRRFEAPAGLDTRPTLDRVKEAVFGMFQFDLPGGDVLDLFSGSGNLGLEAASRGAAHVVCNDHAPSCAALIRKNARSLGLSERVEVTQLDYADCIRRLAAAGRTFRLILIDAPYAAGTGRLAAELAVREGLLGPEGRIMLEHASAGVPQVDETLCAVLTTRRYGACSVSIIKGVEQQP